MIRENIYLIFSHFSFRQLRTLWNGGPVSCLFPGPCWWKESQMNSPARRRLAVFTTKLTGQIWVMGCYGLLWDILGYCGLLWVIMGYYGLLCDVMGCYGLLSTIVECYGMLWNVMGYHGLLLTIAGCYGILWEGICSTLGCPKQVMVPCV